VQVLSLLLLAEVSTAPLSSTMSSIVINLMLQKHSHGLNGMYHIDRQLYGYNLTLYRLLITILIIIVLFCGVRSFRRGDGARGQLVAV
jgi:hypothetical protein